jgi:hypothetical protein
MADCAEHSMQTIDRAATSQRIRIPDRFQRVLEPGGILYEKAVRPIKILAIAARGRYPKG